MTKFTNGPWTTRAAKKPDNVGGYDSAIVAGNYIIAETYEVVADGVKMPVSANARLISSAPDMYEALRDGLAIVNNISMAVKFADDKAAFNAFSAWVDQARAVLSKAEGGT